MAQRDTVAEHLRRHGGITEQTAQRLGIRMLRVRVHELRRAGWRISTCKEPSPYGGPVDHGHYVLVQEPGQPSRQRELGL